MKIVKQLALLALGAAAVPLYAQDETGITPYRPSVSSPAQLPLAGQLEFEVGGWSGKSDQGRRKSVPYTFKLAFSEEWGVLLGGEAYIGVRDAAGQRERGVGDTSLVLKRAFPVDSGTAFGLELGVKLPTAKDAIGSGKRDVVLNGIFSKDIGDFHLDANLNAARLGAYAPGTGRMQTGMSASVSTPVSEQWGLTAELSDTHQRRQAHATQLLLAAGYSPTKLLTIDVGVAKGINGASGNWSLFSGMVLPLARLW
ncbi:transporter [Pseudoduganella sp. LjRoot289]|uniref:transporter n=1 Tax=Pseudoduganella sp. LjRoot289 TaxID=3342314 RepID=UPI003ED11EAB